MCYPEYSQGLSALAGLGLAYLPEDAVNDYLDNGKLVCVLAG
jgi:DNA-binding transcriptional LysR family regulator